jgi:isopentenyl-diphosphate Delta-isomerase
MGISELLPVVNENDEIVDYQPRSVCHNPAKRLPHRKIHVVLLNSKGEIGLNKRSQTVETCPGMYTSLTAGHVKKDQTYKDTAYAELWEEVGVKEIQLEEKGKVFVYDDPCDAFIQIFTGIYDGPFDIDPSEVEAVEFFKPSNLHTIKDRLTISCKAVLKELGYEI